MTRYTDDLYAFLLVCPMLYVVQVSAVGSISDRAVNQCRCQGVCPQTSRTEDDFSLLLLADWDLLGD